MENIILNTEELKQKADEILKLKAFFDNNKEKYLKYRYSDSVIFSNVLNKIYKSFEDVSDNLNVLGSTLKEYCGDIEAVERTFGEINSIPYKGLESKQESLK